MFRNWERRPTNQHRYRPRLEPLEDRDCPAPVALGDAPVDDQTSGTPGTPGTDENANQAFNQGADQNLDSSFADPSGTRDISAFNLGAQFDPNQFDTRNAFDRLSTLNPRFSRFLALNGRGDLSQFGRANLNDSAATGIPQSEIAGAFGTSASVQRFLLQIDPMTPVQALPVELQSGFQALPTSNIRNVGTSTVLRLTANRVGGADPTADLLPEEPPTLWLNLPLPTQDATPPATRPTTPPQTSPNPQREEAPPRQEVPPEADGARATLQQLRLLPPQEDLTDLIGVVFSQVEE